MRLFDWLKGKSSPQARPERDDVPRQVWNVGARVLAAWLDGFFYPGHVRQIEGSSCAIAFDDGVIAWVNAANVRQPDVETGSKVFCRFHAGPAYLPGTVRRHNGEKLQVEYENGAKEWTTLSMVRVKHPLANVPEPTPAAHFGPAMPAEPDLPGAMFGGGPLTGTQTAVGPMMGPAPAFIPDIGEPVADSNWRNGDRVLGRWFDFYWYPATVLAIGTKGYQLLFDDGDQRVVSDRGLMPLDVEEGEELFIRPKDQSLRVYTPARVLRVRGETIDVELDDGTHEANQKLSRARLWRCPVGTRGAAFDEGDRVWAQDMDGFVYPADVLSMDHDKIVVSFLDGPERMLTPELLRAFELRTGTAVQCRWKAGPAYFPGKITQTEGDRVHLAYDDGDQEWTTIRLVRLLPKEDRL
jgi:hypothetical protein